MNTNSLNSWAEKNWRAWIACVGATAFTLLAGCVSLNQSEAVDVAVVNLQFTDATVLETTAIFTVRLQNETPEPLVLEGGVHKFYIDGAFVGKGMSNERIEVPRLGSVTQPITVYLRNLSMSRRIKSIIESQKVDYRLDSLLYAQGKGGSRLRVSHEGKLDLNEFRPTPRDRN